MRQRWTATVPTGRWGDVSGVYENEYSSTGNTRRSFGVSQQFWYSPNLRIGLKAERELVSGDYDIGLRFSVPIYYACPHLLWKHCYASLATPPFEAIKRPL